MYVPNMTSEIIDAVDYLFADEPDIVADCLLYMRGLGDLPEMAKSLSDRARMELVRRDRCDRCGGKLQMFRYGEVHNELDEKPVEQMYVMMCPNCTTPKNGFTQVQEDEY